ncbi:MAG: saccharopine dehydrogenase NADP-binding domain-containing protein [Flavobacteriales bacterium]|nr:saccharopine dehydrogenase NADP-binding domain-containing protein [Flavobacteriales bacterium]MCB9168578.1 saccharopine dehydrogenase NADP-binding domain-containing protein [Flavobacteriales bacterium]
MRKVLIIGAGRSASSLIRYMIDHAPSEDWRLTVADKDIAHVRSVIGQGSEVAEAVAFDATDGSLRARLIEAHDLVISMLPPSLHLGVVRDCLRIGRHAITPSYVPDEMWSLDAEAKTRGLVLLNELGLDPGIDHMSAMRILDRIRAEGGRMMAFESYCGGLIAPESDTNPWGYKFTWNPRNVVLAGQGGMARYIKDGEYKYVPYHKLFQRTVRIAVPHYGAYDGYANRDSLRYRRHYGLDEVPTLVRGTLRKAGFCTAWDVFVQLGCTDDSFIMELPKNATWQDFLMAFLPHDVERGPRENLAHYLGLDPKGEIMAKLEWLGLFGRGRIQDPQRSPAAILQSLLEEKWQLLPGDRDMVVMWHRFRYTVDDRQLELQASLVSEGESEQHTAMSRTVGLPVAIAAKLVLNGQIAQRGVLMPIAEEIYAPVLHELEDLGIRFLEEELEA